MSAASVLRQKCLKAAQKLARMSAADDDGYCSCVSCNKSLHYKQMDGGHFIPKGASSFWSLKQININPQCKGCNGFGMRHGSAAQSYTLWMIEEHGQPVVDDMLLKKNELCKMLKVDYVDLLKELESLINIERERLGE